MQIVDVPKLLRQDSLIWIGKTPSDWKYWRLKDVAYLSPSFSSIKPENFDECTLLPMEKVNDDGTYVTELLQPFIDISSGLNLIEAGDVIIAKITPCMENGKGAFISSLPTSYAFGSTEFHVFRPTSKIDATFLYYYTWNPIFRKYAEVNMTGAAGQKRISSRFIKHTKIFLPPLPEQKLISAYLDKTTAIIDKAISVKKEQLKKLEELKKSIIYKAVTKGLDDSVKMKDTGIEWIGETSSDWKYWRLKDVAYLSPSFSSIKPEDFDECTILPMEKVNDDGTFDTELFKPFIDISNGLNLIEAGDVIIAKITPCMENGKGAFIESLPTRYAFGSTEFHVFRPTSKIMAPFLYYYTWNPIYRKYAEVNMTGAAGQKRISSRFIKHTKIFLPPLPEQKRIVNYLTEKTTEIDTASEKITLQIEKLEEYKKSLIHECVTGKRRISENDIPEAV